MKILILLNEGIKKDREKYVSAASSISRIFNDDDFFVVSKFGGELFSRENNLLDIVLQSSLKDNLKKTIKLVLNSFQIDLIVSVGDNLFTSIITRELSLYLIDKKFKTSLFSISLDKDNTGVIASLTISDIENLSFSDLSKVSLDAIEVSGVTGIIGYAFNEMRISDLMKGVYKGERCNINALELAVNNVMKRKEGRAYVVEDKFSLCVDNDRKPILDRRLITEIIASPIQFDNIRNRSIFGPVSNIDVSMRDKAALILSNKPIVDEFDKDISSFRLTMLETLIFSKYEVVYLNDLNRELCVIIDCYPYSLENDNNLRLRLVNDVLCVYRKKSLLGGANS